MDGQTSCPAMSHLVKCVWEAISFQISSVFRHVEYSYHKNRTTASLINQVLFFMLCDCCFCPEDRLTGLYCLLFYNVSGYLVAYASQLLSLHDYTPIVRVSEQSGVRHLALTATKVVLDLAKVVTFAITAVFVLLVFGLEQGLEHFNPTWAYIFLTSTYYVLTEPACQCKVPAILSKLQLDCLENLESLWCPVLSRALSSLASVLMIFIVWFGTDAGWLLIFSSAYINVHLCLVEMGTHWNCLMAEKSVLDRFCCRYATKEELGEQDDVCAVCLQPMRKARITPCHHMFHEDCLRKCLKQQATCPVCKQSL